MFALGSSFTCVRILQVLYLEFSRIVCVSLFSYQGSCLLDSSFTLPLLPDPVKNFFSVFSGYFLLLPQLPGSRNGSAVSVLLTAHLLYHTFHLMSTTFFNFYNCLNCMFIRCFLTARLGYHSFTRLSTVFYI